MDGITRTICFNNIVDSDIRSWVQFPLNCGGVGAMLDASGVRENRSVKRKWFGHSTTSKIDTSNIYRTVDIVRINRRQDGNVLRTLRTSGYLYCVRVDDGDTIFFICVFHGDCHIVLITNVRINFVTLG